MLRRGRVPWGTSLNHHDVEWYRDLKRFLSDHNYRVPHRDPYIGSVELNPYRLYSLVRSAGGHAEVTRQHQWHEIARRLSPGSSKTHTIAYTLHKWYWRYLRGFELWQGSKRVLTPAEVAEPVPDKPSLRVHHQAVVKSSPMRQATLHEFLSKALPRRVSVTPVSIVDAEDAPLSVPSSLRRASSTSVPVPAADAVPRRVSVSRELGIIDLVSSSSSPGDASVDQLIRSSQPQSSAPQSPQPQPSAPQSSQPQSSREAEPQTEAASLQPAAQSTSSQAETSSKRSVLNQTNQHVDTPRKQAASQGTSTPTSVASSRSSKMQHAVHAVQSPLPEPMSSELMSSPCQHAPSASSSSSPAPPMSPDSSPSFRPRNQQRFLSAVPDRSVPHRSRNRRAAAPPSSTSSPIPVSSPSSDTTVVDDVATSARLRQLSDQLRGSWSPSYREASTSAATAAAAAVPPSPPSPVDLLPSSSPFSTPQSHAMTPGSPLVRTKRLRGPRGTESAAKRARLAARSDACADDVKGASSSGDEPARAPMMRSRSPSPVPMMHCALADKPIDHDADLALLLQSVRSRRPRHVTSAGAGDVARMADLSDAAYSDSDSEASSIAELSQESVGKRAERALTNSSAACRADPRVVPTHWLFVRAPQPPPRHSADGDGTGDTASDTLLAWLAPAAPRTLVAPLLNSGMLWRLCRSPTQALFRALFWHVAYQREDVSVALAATESLCLLLRNGDRRSSFHPDLRARDLCDVVTRSGGVLFDDSCVADSVCVRDDSTTAGAGPPPTLPLVLRVFALLLDCHAPAFSAVADLGAVIMVALRLGLDPGTASITELPMLTEHLVLVFARAAWSTQCQVCAYVALRGVCPTPRHAVHALQCVPTGSHLQRMLAQWFAALSIERITGSTIADAVAHVTAAATSLPGLLSWLPHLLDRLELTVADPARVDSHSAAVLATVELCEMAVVCDAGMPEAIVMRLEALCKTASMGMPSCLARHLFLNAKERFSTLLRWNGKRLIVAKTDSDSGSDGGQVPIDQYLTHTPPRAVSSTKIET